MGALALAGLEPGDHVCWTFDSEETRLDATAGFIRSGIRDEHKVVYYTADLAPSDVDGRHHTLDGMGVAVVGLAVPDVGEHAQKTPPGFVGVAEVAGRPRIEL